VNFLAAPPPPPFEPRKCRFRHDLTTSKFWVFKALGFLSFVSMLAENGLAWSVQNRSSPRWFPKTRVKKNCESFVLFLLRHNPPEGVQKMSIYQEAAWMTVCVCVLVCLSYRLLSLRHRRSLCSVFFFSRVMLRRRNESKSPP